MRTGRQQDRAGAKRPLAVLLVGNDHRPVGAQPRITVHQRDAVALQVLLNGARHLSDHVPDPGAQSIHHHVRRKGDTDAVGVAAHPAAEVNNRIPQCLHGHARDRDCRATDPRPAFDHRHAVTEVRDLIGSLLTGRAAADHHQIEIVSPRHAAIAHVTGHYGNP
jgi:hypothetical protein